MSLRGLVLAERPNDRWPAGARLPASAPATLLEARDGKLLVEAVISGRPGHAAGPTRAPSSSSTGRSQSVAALVASAHLLLAANDRPVLTAAYLREAVAARPVERRGVGPPRPGRRAARGVGPARRGREARPRRRARGASGASGSSRDRTAGATDTTATAYRRAHRPRALRADLAEEARLRLLIACGPVGGPEAPGRPAGRRTAREGPGRVPRVVPRLAAPRRRSCSSARASCRRSRRAPPSRATPRPRRPPRRARIEAASEVSATTPDAARSGAADRLVARLTKSFPRTVESEKPVVSAAGRARHVRREGGKTLLDVTRPDGRDAIQPYPVRGADPATLAFDADRQRSSRGTRRPSRAAAGRALLDLSRAASSSPPRSPSRSSSPSPAPRGPGADPGRRRPLHDVPRLLAGRPPPPRRLRGLHAGRHADPEPARPLRRGGRRAGRSSWSARSRRPASWTGRASRRRPRS